MDKEDVFTCRNWRNGTCESSDAVVLEESSLYLQMGCRTCRGGWVITMPEGKAKARYQNRLDEIKRKERERREREQSPIYFT